MELFRVRKKPKCPRVSTIVYHNHNHNQGNQRGRRPNDLPKLSSPLSVSDLSSSGCVEENLLSVSSRLAVGTTMKKLLADEMRKDSESGRRSPSVIANLMGLDWLPAQHNSSKQHKRVSDSYQKKCNSDGLGKSVKGNDSGSHRKHGKGQQKCKDVYEVSERSNSETGSTISRAPSYRNLSDEDEVAFVRQKFIDVKRFSTDEKLRHSKEFHDALEVLDSNKDLLLKFLQEPNSLFTKHLHHLHGAQESHSGCVHGVKSSNTLKCNVDVIGNHSGGEASRKIDISQSRTHRDNCQCNLYHRHNVDSRTMHLSAEAEEDVTFSATRIVVLKPNLGKARDTGRSFSSSTPSCDLASDSELQYGYSNIMQLRSEKMGRKIKHDKSEHFGTKSRESRELAREVTRRMKHRLGADSFHVSSSAYKGYSADESSGDISENDSSYESEVTMPGSTTSFNRGTCNKASRSPHIESSINREAKKRLSRRWNMTHRSQETGSPVKGNTLAEMLAIPDVDVRPRIPDYAAARDERLCRSRRDGVTTESTTPSGISSRDGWKDGGVWNSPKFMSTSASSSRLGSPKSSTRHEAITAERFLVRSRSMDSGKSRAFKRDSERHVRSLSGSMTSRNKECLSTCVEIINDIQEVSSSVNMVTNRNEEQDSPDVKSVIIEMASREPVPLDDVVDSEHRHVRESVSYLDELVPATRTPSSVLPHPHDRFMCDESSVQQEPTSSCDVESSSFLQFSTKPESPESSKESEQPSPVSVLEPPFVEEISSDSECFERVSAELHGLRMQLQLLKQESEGYDEGSMLISSDECEEQSTTLDDGKGHCCIGEDWESSYLLDALTYSGLNEIDRDMFLETWHSPDCPIGPRVFTNLEKKYGVWTSCLRSERKLLFDRINAGITQIFSQYLDVDRWLKPFLRNASPQWWKDGLKTELSNLLKRPEKSSIETVMDATILGGMQWFKYGDHLGTVGRDIERILMDELVEEIISL